MGGGGPRRTRTRDIVLPRRHDGVAAAAVNGAIVAYHPTAVAVALHETKCIYPRVLIEVPPCFTSLGSLSLFVAPCLLHLPRVHSHPGSFVLTLATDS